MKTRVSVGSCFIQVSGMDFTCPFCKTLVKSGTQHQCNPKTIEVLPKRRGRKKENGDGGNQ